MSTAHLFRSISRRLFFGALLTLTLIWLGSLDGARAAETKKPLKILLLTGGGYHDYQKLVPYITNQLSQKIEASFDVRFDMESMRDPKFADAFDLVLYDLCFDEAPDEVLANAIQTTKNGKPTVMLHCAVHAFRKSPKISEWESCCGMRSKVHDRYQSFTVKNVDPKSMITASFPDGWKTQGDELYQTISIDPGSHPLLKVTSPQDGREHVVCWTWNFGKGKVFATTLGHDMKTVSTPEYIQLVANGIKWAAGVK